MPYGPPGRPSAASARHAGRRREDEQRAATGVRDEARPMRQATPHASDRRPQARADPPQGARVVELEHALAHGDDGHRSSERTTPPGCVATFAGRTPAAHNAKRLPRSSPTTATVRRRHVVGVGAGGHVRSSPRPGVNDHEPVGRLGRRQHRAAGRASARWRGAPGSVTRAPPPLAASTKASTGGSRNATATRPLAGRTRRLRDRCRPPSPGRRVGGEPRRARRLRRRRQLVHGLRATARDQRRERER